MQRHEYLYNPRGKKNSHDKTIETVQKSLERRKEKKKKKEKKNIGKQVHEPIRFRKS